MSTAEHLTKARDCAAFAAEDARRALVTASSLEALVLLPLIADAARLAMHIAQLIEARDAETDNRRPDDVD